jgi:hypothetical protein
VDVAEKPRAPLEILMLVISPRVRTLVSLAATAALAVSCSKSSDNGGGGTNPTPAITIAASVSSQNITQGAQANVTVTVSRTGGFAGDVVVTAEGLPTGVTASALTITAGTTSGTLTLTAAAAATVAPASVTIRGTGTGVTSATASLTLNVVAATATGAASVTFSPSTLNITQGQTVHLTATITRTGGFTGAVTLDVPNPPAGLTVVITPGAASATATSVTGGSADIAFTASPTMAVGGTSVTVTAAGTNVAATSVTITTTVAAATTGSGNAVWTFCPASGIPVFVAVQDGTTAAFTKVNAGANNTYSFTITQSKGAVAYEFNPSGTTYNLTIFHGTQAEIVGQGAANCANQAQTGKTITGTVTGLALTDLASITLGSSATSVQGAQGTSFTLSNVPNGNQDLVATRSSFTINGSTVTTTFINLVIRRNLNLAAGSVITPAIDLSATSTEAVAPQSRNLTIGNLNGDQAIAINSFITANGTFGTLLSDINPSTSATRTFFTVPDSKRIPGDLNYVAVVAQSTFQTAVTSTRTAATVSAASADKTITLGPALNSPTISALSTGAPWLLRGAITVQPQYANATTITFNQAGSSPRSVQLSYSAGWIGSATSLNADISDLSAAGYTASWGMTPLAATTYSLTGVGWNVTGGIISSPFVDGASFMIGSRTGTYP